MSENKGFVVSIILVLILPAIIFVSYCIYYSFEIGFLHYFNVPYDLISPDITSRLPVLYAFTAQLSFLLFFIFFVYIYAHHLNEKFVSLDNRIKLVIMLVLALVILVATLAIFLGPANIFRYLTVYILAPLLPAIVIIIRLYQVSNISFILKIIITTVISFSTIVLLLMHAGRISAENKNIFYTCTLKNTQEVVVLRMYGNNLVCAPIDRASKSIEPKFIVLKLDELSKDNIFITSEVLGPLKP